jgi:hypothetical protein
MMFYEAFENSELYFEEKHRQGIPNSKKDLTRSIP